MLRPRVSVAMPVYNAEGTVHEAVASAIEQTYEDLEIVVVDNASTDATAEIVQSFGDPRIRLHRNPSNVGVCRNHDRSAQLSRGAYVKFLHADDVLHPTCVERMVESMDRRERIGMVFARRRIEIADESNPAYRQFREDHSDAVHRLGLVQAVNDGPELLRTWLRSGFPANWVGEPSSVMVRREALARLGLFNRRVRSILDVEMWARIMAYYDVAYIDDELSIFRFHPSGLSHKHEVAHRSLDILWVLEGLAVTGNLLTWFPEVSTALRRERWQVTKTLGRLLVHDPRVASRHIGDVGTYAAFIAGRHFGRAPLLHEPLGHVDAHRASIRVGGAAEVTAGHRKPEIWRSLRASGTGAERL